jgi:hypothetical protein
MKESTLSKITASVAVAKGMAQRALAAQLWFSALFSQQPRVHNRKSISCEVASL